MNKSIDHNSYERESALLELNKKLDLLKFLENERQKVTTDFGKYKIDGEIKQTKTRISELEKRIYSLRVF